MLLWSIRLFYFTGLEYNQQEKHGDQPYMHHSKPLSYNTLQLLISSSRSSPMFSWIFLVAIKSPFFFLFFSTQVASKSHFYKFDAISRFNFLPFWWSNWWGSCFLSKILYLSLLIKKILYLSLFSFGNLCFFFKLHENACEDRTQDISISGTARRTWIRYVKLMPAFHVELCSLHEAFKFFLSQLLGFSHYLGNWWWCVRPSFGWRAGTPPWKRQVPSSEATFLFQKFQNLLENSEFCIMIHAWLASSPC